MPPTAQDFQKELNRIFESAQKKGMHYVEISSGELHRRVGGYPSSNHRMPTCCEVMRRNLTDADEIGPEPPSGKGAILRIRYKIPRTATSLQSKTPKRRRMQSDHMERSPDKLDKMEVLNGISQFLNELRLRKGKDLLVFACSAAKRTDREVRGLPDFPSQNLLSDFEAYRKCTRANHGEKVDASSRPVPACLRYNGKFYRPIRLDLWKKLIEWPVLILSAYYGFIRPFDWIRYYELALAKVSKRCKNLLPMLLQSYIDHNKYERVLFFTSRQYSTPFSSLTNAFRVCFIDASGHEVVGPFGSKYYEKAGQIVSSLPRGDKAWSGPNGLRFSLKPV